MEYLKTNRSVVRLVTWVDWMRRFQLRGNHRNLVLIQLLFSACSLPVLQGFWHGRAWDSMVAHIRDTVIIDIPDTFFNSLAPRILYSFRPTQCSRESQTRHGMNRILLQLRGFRFAMSALCLIDRPIIGQVNFLLSILRDERISQELPFDLSSCWSSSSRLNEEVEMFSS